VLQLRGFLGNAGRNMLTGPGFANFDLSLVKNHRLRLLGTGGQIEVRFEVFNVEPDELLDSQSRGFRRRPRRRSAARDGACHCHSELRLGEPAFPSHHLPGTRVRHD